MADFTGFYYDNIHSSTYHLIRTSEGDRYEEDLFPSFKDEEKDLVGGKGKAYFGTTLKEKKIPISVVFEDLREEDFRALRRWLRPDKFKAFRLDERPYKAYWAKISKEPTFEYVCFMEEDEDSLSKVRVYKGEAKIEFVAYDPMGYCNDDSYKIELGKKIIFGEEVDSKDKRNWQELKAYSPLWMKDDNLIEWAPSSGLLNDMSGFNDFSKSEKSAVTEISTKIYNPGDVPTEYELCFELAADAPPPVNVNGVLEYPSLQIYLSDEEEVSNENFISSFVIYLTGLRIYDRIVIDTKKHLFKVYSPNREIIYKMVDGVKTEEVKYLDKYESYTSNPEEFVYLESNRQLRYDLVKSSHWQNIPCNFKGNYSIMKIQSAIALNNIAIKYGYQYY